MHQAVADEGDKKKMDADEKKRETVPAEGE